MPERSAVVIQGPAGDEKDLISYQFLAEGLRYGEGAFVVLSKISPDDFREEMRKLGLKIEKYEQRGEFFIVDWYSHRSTRIDGVEEDGAVFKSSESRVNLEIAISEVVAKLATFERKRAMVDVLSPAMKIFGSTEIYELSQTLRTKFRDEGITSLFLVEKGMHGEEELSSLHQAFDGVIDIEKKEVEGKRETLIGTLFMRGVRAETQYYPLAYQDGEIVIKSPSEAEEFDTAPEEEEIPEEALIVIDEKLIFSEGMSLLEAGKYEDAMEKFTKVTEINPDYKEAWNAKGIALMHLGRHNGATECFKKALTKVLEFVDRDQLREMTSGGTAKQALREIIKEEISLSRVP
ncbi:MAG: ATPase domain-containing protein, partial [Thermoplasmata archaeon]